jgi:SAM-dependent methyltransferase
MTTQSPWETQAENWTAWARTPGHDVFPHFFPAFMEEIAARPGGRTLEVGCGEGRVVRELAAHGHDVTGLDVSPTLAARARDADARPSYVLGDATALPFADATFGTVVAYNSLQALTRAGDMARAVRECARVLAPGGGLCLCVGHPMTDVGHVRSIDDGGAMVTSGAYFDSRYVDETVTKDGLTMNFHGWTFPIEDYARALEDAGLVIERLREPRPPEASAGGWLARWRHVPLFLFIRALKVTEAR